MEGTEDTLAAGTLLRLGACANPAPQGAGAHDNGKASASVMSTRGPGLHNIVLGKEQKAAEGRTMLPTPQRLQSAQLGVFILCLCF